MTVVQEPGGPVDDDRVEGDGPADGGRGDKRKPEGSRFKYEAETLDGEAVSGEIVALSAQAARNQLAVQGLRVLRISERKGLQVEITKQRVPLVEILHFSRQMATFLRAGVPITEAVDDLRIDAGNKRFRVILGDVLERVSAGRSVADALAEHEEVFPSYYLAMLRAAEYTGRLEDAFDQLAAYIARDLELRRQVRRAMIYPVILMVLAVVVCLIMVVFAIPRFADFFEDFGAELPLPTRMLLAVSDFVQSPAGLVSGVVVAGLVVAGLLWIRTPRGRRSFHGLQLRLPVLSTVVTYASTERFTRVLGSLLDAGVALPEALPTAIDCSDNLVFKERLTVAVDAIIAGQGFAEPLAATELFPRTVIRMVRVGERTGELSTQLEQAAGFYKEELNYAVDKLTAWFEPLTIILIGAVVGFVALAMLSAMYGIYGQVEV